jgi:hypothetical protein
MQRMPRRWQKSQARVIRRTLRFLQTRCLYWTRGHIEFFKDQVDEAE